MCSPFPAQHTLLSLPSKSFTSLLLSSKSPQGPDPSLPCPLTHSLAVPLKIQWREMHPCLGVSGDHSVPMALLNGKLLTNISFSSPTHANPLGPQCGWGSPGIAESVLNFFPLENLQVMIWYLTLEFHVYILLIQNFNVNNQHRSAATLRPRHLFIGISGLLLNLLCPLLSEAKWSRFLEPFPPSPSIIFISLL